MENLERVLWAFQVLWSGGLYFSKGDDLRFEALLGASYQLNRERWDAFGRIPGFFDGDFALKWHPLSGRTYTPCARPTKRPSIAVTPPYSVSEREHLEAALIWREFLRNKLPEKEIEAQLKFKVRQ